MKYLLLQAQLLLLLLLSCSQALLMSRRKLLQPLLCRSYRTSTQAKPNHYLNVEIPSDFGTRFQIPHYPDDVALDRLQKLNSHPNDSLLSFNREAHTYHYKDQQIKSSVTQVVQAFFEKFDSLTTAEKMTKSAKWPREGYVHQNGAAYSIDEILKKWDDIGEYARNRGTWLHYNIERILNGLPAVDPSLPELQQFHAFKAEVMDKLAVTPFRTEWRIVAPDLGIAGSVDFVGLTKSGEFVMMDWKRSKRLSSSAESHFIKYAKPPIDHILDCDATKYSLQLNLYRYILERYYGLPVAKCVLASFHPDLQSKYFYYEVPCLQKEIESIIAYRKDNASIR